MKNGKKTNKKNKDKKKELPGYEPYPSSEDIFNKDEELDINIEDEIPIEDISKGPQKRPKIPIGENLDVPGSELDDEKEAIGSEDEENNYYSLGGDRHEDLEEDKPETPLPE
jgi:hypothetical protein